MPEKRPATKIVQLICAPSANGTTLLALCEDGSVWQATQFITAALTSYDWVETTPAHPSTYEK